MPLLMPSVTVLQVLVKTKSFLGLLFSFVLAACSSTNNNAPVNLKAGLPVGAVLSLTGNANVYGQDQRLGLELAQAAFKPGSSMPLNLSIEDGGSDEAGAINAFNLLINQGTTALIGPTLSQQAFAASPIAQRRGVPVLAPSNTATGIPEIGSFISRVSAQSSVIAPLSINKVMQLDPAIKRVAVFYANDDAYSTSETTIFQKAIKAKGLNTVTVQRTQLNDQDFLNQITSALRAKPDLVVLSLQAVDGGNLIRQLRELGFKGRIVVGNGMNTPNIYPICQRFCDGILIAQAYSPELKTKENQAFVATHKAQQGGRVPAQLTAQAYTAYQVIAEAAQRLNKREPLKGMPLRQARLLLNKEILSGTYNTPLGKISFSRDGEVKQESFYVAEVQMNPDGQTGRFALLK